VAVWLSASLTLTATVGQTLPVKPTRESA